MNKNKLFVLSIVLTAALVFSGMGFNPTQAQVNAAAANLSDQPLYLPMVANHNTVNLGLLIPLTGPVAFLGASAQKGVQMAVDEWNAKGGVLGKRIFIAPGDGQCSAGPAAAEANRLINEVGVHYIIGEICSSASIAVSEIAQANGVVMLSPTSTNAQVTINADGSVKPYVFRACFIDPFQGMVMAQFARSQGLSQAYYLSQADNAYSTGLAESFTTSFTALSGVIVGHEDYPNQSKTLPEIMDEVLASGADLLYLPYFSSDVNAISAAAKAKGVNAVLLGGDGWDTSDLDLTATDGGFFTTQFTAQNSTPAVAAWVQAFHDLYGQDPDAAAALSYDSANMMLTAIKNGNLDQAAVVKDQLASLVFPGMTGPLIFDQFHNPQKQAVIMHIHAGTVSFYSMYP